MLHMCVCVCVWEGGACTCIYVCGYVHVHVQYKNVHIEHNRTTHYIQMDTCVIAYIIHGHVQPNITYSTGQRQGITITHLECICR